jgi:hypothetical protein
MASLEALLEKITDPNLKDEDWKSIESFLNIVKRNKERFVCNFTETFGPSFLP